MTINDLRAGEGREHAAKAHARYARAQYLSALSGTALSWARALGAFTTPAGAEIWDLREGSLQKRQSSGFFPGLLSAAWCMLRGKE